jgi:cyclohexa-1,5-dienecarbonyl-CoA hydratase
MGIMGSVASELARLAVEITPPVARIRLHHPPLNVIDIAMMDELAGTIARITGLENLWIIVVSAEGKAFSAGVDVAAHTPENVNEMLGKFHAVIRELVTTTKVTVAGVRGLCLGGGAELAMACDIVYTTESAQWGFPEIKLGCFPPVACAALASIVGQKRASELILTGRPITGTRATEIGLATRAVADGELENAIGECIEQLSKLSPAALRIAKKASYAWDAMHFEKGLSRAEKIYFEDLTEIADMREGIRAFMEKREPRWSGK